jgi:hypothetical protein
LPPRPSPCAPTNVLATEHVVPTPKIRASVTYVVKPTTNLVHSTTCLPGQEPTVLFVRLNPPPLPTSPSRRIFNNIAPPHAFATAARGFNTSTNHIKTPSAHEIHFRSNPKKTVGIGKKNIRPTALQNDSGHRAPATEVVQHHSPRGAPRRSFCSSLPPRFVFSFFKRNNCKSTDKLTLFLSFTPALPFNQVLAPKDTHGPPHHKPTTTTNKRLNALVKVCAKEKRVNVNVLTALPVRVAVDPRAPTIAVGTVSANHWRNLPVITHLSKPTSVWLV